MANSIISRLHFLSDLPLVGKYLLSAWRSFAYYKRRLRWKVNSRRSGGAAPIQPIRLFWVTTNRIKYRVSSEPFNRQDAGRVIGGNWDQERGDLTTDDSLYDALVERYQNDTPWSEIDFYQKQIDRIKRGESAWGCRTVAELQKRYEKLDDVHTSMLKQGYQPAREVVDGRSIMALDEIGVHIGRDGELLFAGEGNHRIRLAHIVGLDTVAVQVLVRHTDWQKKRNKIASDKATPEELGVDSDHPDIQILY